MMHIKTTVITSLLAIFLLGLTTPAIGQETGEELIREISATGLSNNDCICHGSSVAGRCLALRAGG